MLTKLILICIFSPNTYHELNSKTEEWTLEKQAAWNALAQFMQHLGFEEGSNEVTVAKMAMRTILMQPDEIAGKTPALTAAVIGTSSLLIVSEQTPTPHQDRIYLVYDSIDRAHHWCVEQGEHVSREEFGTFFEIDVLLE